MGSVVVGSRVVSEPQYEVTRRVNPEDPEVRVLEVLVEYRDGSKRYFRAWCTGGIAGKIELLSRAGGTQPCNIDTFLQRIIQNAVDEYSFPKA
jgi:hypothetical protein